MIQSMTKEKNRVQYTLTQSSEKAITLPKTHAHIMMTQLKIKDGIKAYGNKGDEAIKKLKTTHMTSTYAMQQERNVL